MSAVRAGPDAMVTVKVTYDGTNRRVKMPLREMVPNVLEEHIRTFLHIPTDRSAIIERYSDSAAAFILLDSTNLPIYKQLYRAAKAKSKLKLRVTLLEAKPVSAPKPVSVETVTENPAAQPGSKPSPVPSEASLPLRSHGLTMPQQEPIQTTLPLRSHGLSMSKQYDPALLAKAASIVSEREELRKDFESRLSCLMSRQSLSPVPVPAPADAQDTQDTQDTHVEPKNQTTTALYAVCCNSCAVSIPGAHYHCSTCEDGDFDLCQSCIDQGITCHSDNHWLIKRTIVDGNIIKSSTEKISPKPQPKPKAAQPEPIIAPTYPNCLLPVVSQTPAVSAATQRPSDYRSPPVYGTPVSLMPAVPDAPAWATSEAQRTCNACLHELPESKFLHCKTCEDFDLCQPCFAGDDHGHHPMHAFAPAVEGTQMPGHIDIKMPAGRNKMHMAVCDGCDKNITGVRHKCLDCPDWDYCADCNGDAGFIHPHHRFVAIYEPLAEIHSCTVPQPMHMGICCDGPLCNSSAAWPSYIQGVRYKCAVCNDLDFCANCEASPANDHNKTHPLIKFKTPVRHVSVTTTGEHQDGRQLQPMGDRFEHYQAPSSTNSVNAVQTVVDVKPEKPKVPAVQEARVEVKKEEPLVDLQEAAPVVEAVKEEPEEELNAVFVRDTVSDGTIFGLNHVFEQTWTLRNDGNTTWPAGCAVKFSGGDYMGHVDSTHPAGISDLVSASQSTVCYSQLAPGQEFQFTVLLRTPARAGKFISYWRLTTEDGIRFGERLWCEVNARAVKAAPPTPAFEEDETEKEAETEKADESQASSTMIFPKLEKESPSASIHEETKYTPASPLVSALPSPADTPASKPYVDWDGSDDGFMTDEEYDILDASDEEYLEEQHRKTLKQ